MRRGYGLILMLSFVIVLSYSVFINRDVILELNVKGPFAGLFSTETAAGGVADVSKVERLLYNISNDTAATWDYFLSRDFQFENISFVSADKSNNLYFIDRSMERVVKLNAKRQVERVIKSDEIKAMFDGGIKYKDSICLASEIVGDDNGNFYVVYRVLDQYGMSVKKEVVVRYSSDNRQQTVYFQRDYEGGNTPIRSGRLKSLQVYGDFIYIFYFAGNEDNDVILYKINKNNNLDIKEDKQFHLPEGVYPLDIKGIDWNNIYYTTMNGEIYRVNEQQQQLFYSGSKAKDMFFPWYIGSASQDQLYFADMLKGGIYRIDKENPQSQEQTTFSKKDVQQAGIVRFSNIFSNSGGAIVSYATVNRENSQNGNGLIVLLGRDGSKDFIEKAEVASDKLLYRWLIWGSLVISIILLIWVIRVVYIEWMDQRVSLYIKQLAVFIPLFLVALLITSSIIYSSLNVKYEQEADQKLMLLAHSGSVTINGDVLKKIVKPEQYMKGDYRLLRSATHSLFEGKPGSGADQFGQSLYFALYKVDQKDNVYAVLNYDDSVFFTPLEGDKNITAQYLQVFREGKLLRNVTRDSQGYWRYALGPVYDSTGHIAGVFRVAMDMSGFEEDAAKLRSELVNVISVIVVVIMIAVFIMAYFLMMSLRTLRDSVSELAAGNWDVKVDVTSRDEVSELGDGVNSLSQHIRDSLAKVTGLSKSYYRFVPQQFITFLGKDDIMEVNLGDQVERNMTVMVSYIRSFSSISETMTPEKNFNFINQYLKHVGPAVRENNGIIDKYMGSGIMALFDESPENALKAAIDMRKYLNKFNELRQSNGFEAVDIGAGIHSGPLMLGIIGEKDRLAGTVISDNVNLAVLLERLTAAVGASILVTADAFKQMPGHKKYLHRALGSVRLEGKSEPVPIFDVFEGDFAAVRDLKQYTKKAFEEGIGLYHAGRFYDARRKFVEVLRENIDDKAAKMYFLMCDEYARHGAPEGWDGTLDTGKVWVNR